MHSVVDHLVMMDFTRRMEKLSAELTISKCSHPSVVGVLEPS